MKILTWRQYINACAGILCKQTFKQTTFFCVFLVWQDLGYQRRHFVRSQMLETFFFFFFFIRADVTVASELTVWSKRILWFMVLYGVLIWNLTTLTMSALLFEESDWRIMLHFKISGYMPPWFCNSQKQMTDITLRPSRCSESTFAKASSYYNSYRQNLIDNKEK